MDMTSKHFNYDPLSNAFIQSGKDRYKNIISSAKINSYSAIVPNKYLNELERSSGINGMGVILDLIASCLSVNPENRPDLVELYKSDLFKFDKYEKIVIRKFSNNALKSLSGEEIIIKQIVNPIREVINQ